MRETLAVIILLPLLLIAVFFGACFRGFQRWRYAAVPGVLVPWEKLHRFRRFDGPLHQSRAEHGLRMMGVPLMALISMGEQAKLIFHTDEDAIAFNMAIEHGEYRAGIVMRHASHDPDVDDHTLDGMTREQFKEYLRSKRQPR